jgi:phage baseplate assembly protein V
VSEQALQQQIDRLYRRAMMMIAPVQITTTDDTGLIHKAQIGVKSTPEMMDGVPVALHYGFHANMPPKTDAVAIFGNGLRANPVIVGTNHQPSRPTKYAAGEVALYSMFGAVIKLDKNNQLNATSQTAAMTASDDFTVASSNGNVNLNGKSTVTMTTPTTHMTGDLHVDGHITSASLDELEARIASLETRFAALEARLG